MALKAMQKPVIFILAHLCIWLAASSASGGLSYGVSNTGSQKKYLQGEVLVKFSAESRDKVLERYGQRWKISLRQRFKSIGVDRLVLPEGLSVARALEVLREDPDVVYAEPNYYRYLAAVPYDEYFDSLWGLHNVGQTVEGVTGSVDADIDAPEAWDLTTGSDKVVIAVIDSGLDFSHPDLAPNIWSNPEEIPGNGVDDDNNGYVDDVRGWDFIHNDNAPLANDTSGHGTHVAGTIAAAGTTDPSAVDGSGVAGLSWNAKIMALRIFDWSGLGDTASAISAFEYAIAMNADIINCSWGGPGYSQALKDIIGKVPGLVVCAAGNSGADSDVLPYYPASYDSPNIISVAATDADDQIAGFSNYGALSVDIGAPGVNVYSCAPGRRIIWYDNFDDGDLEGWNSGGPRNEWGLTSTEFTSPSFALSDSPGGDYSSRTNSWIRCPVLDLSEVFNARLEFRLKGYSEAGYDFLKVEVSTDGSVWFWEPIRLSGIGVFPWVSGGVPEWTEALVDLSSYGGKSTFYIRFAFLSDWTNDFDGWYIDDVALSAASDVYDGSEYQFRNGTSMAAPHVSGVAALLKGENPNLSAAEIKAVIAGAVDPRVDLEGITTSGGRLNAFKAVRALGSGTLQFSAAAYNADENSGNVTISVDRTGGSNGEVSVSYDATGGTASKGTDYTGADGILSWGDGEVGAKTFTVNLIDDGDREGSETVIISLGIPTGEALQGSPFTTVLTILDDDLQPGVLQFSTGALAVDEDQGLATVTVTRTDGNDGLVSVNYTTSDGSAQAGSDYIPVSGTLIWNDLDDQARIFQVQIIDDTLLENDETVIITLSNPQGGAILGATAVSVLAILENDPEMHGTVEFSAPVYITQENASYALITANRTDGSDGFVSVGYEASGGTASEGVDYTAVSGTLEWDEGEVGARTFSVPIQDDTLYETDETVNLKLSDATGGLKLGEMNTAVLTIVDDDAQPGTLRFSAAEYSVAETSGTAVISVTRVDGSDGAVSVGYTTTDMTAVAGLDYTAVSGTLNWDHGDSSVMIFAVPILTDLLAEGNETLTVSLSAPTGGALLGTPSEASLNIEDVWFNQAPTALDDVFSTPEDTAITVDVLVNDTDPENDPLSVLSVSQGSHGSVTINSGKSVTYWPATDYFGNDIFTYFVDDGRGETDSANVYMTVSPVNDAPVTVDDSADTNEGTAVTIEVLLNDGDPDGDILSISSAEMPLHGTVEIGMDSATVVYIPGESYIGTDSFIYSVSDGNGGTASATVTVTIKELVDEEDEPFPWELFYPAFIRKD